MSEDFLTVKEAARRLGVHVDTVRRRIHDKTFPNAVKLGTSNRAGYRIPLSDLVRYIDSLRTKDTDQ